MGRNNVILKSFVFEEEPSFTPRTPYYWTSQEEKESIKNFPFISDYRVPFVMDVEVNGTPITLRGVIPKGFCYNLADIPWIVEPISYDKHSPFVKNASFIHDYLVSHKRDLYETWELKEKGVKPNDFRVITSLVFMNVLRYNGVSYTKAKIMAFFVDVFQSFLSEWKTLDKTETSL